MKTLRLFVTLMIGALCEAKIWEIPLPEYVQKCYDRVKGEDSSTYVGAKVTWICDNMLDSQLNQTVQWDAQTVSYYNHLLALSIPSNNTDGGANVPRRKRQAGRCLRKEYRMMTDDERTRYFNGVNRLKRDRSVRPNKYDAIARFHVTGLRTAHGGAGFWGWHRLFVNMFESALQEVDPSICQPFWDTTLDSELPNPIQSNLWTTVFMGTRNGPVTAGPFANWRTSSGAPLIRNVGVDGDLMTTTIVNNILSMSRYEDVFPPGVSPQSDVELEHGSPHVYTGGDMSRLNTASNDPLFFGFHAFVDYIFQQFREGIRADGRNPEVYPDEVPQGSSHHSGTRTGFGNLLQADGYRDSASARYLYQRVPTCSASRPQCGSRYLTCVLSTGRCLPTTAGTVASSQSDSTTAQSEAVQQVQSLTTRRRNSVIPLIPTVAQSPVVQGTQLTEGVPSDTMCLKPEKSFGQAIQNDFCTDRTCDTNEWVTIPVKIISVRPPKFDNYKSYPVHKGLIDSQDDIYSPRAYNLTNRFISRRLSNPKTYKRCERDESVGKVFLTSRGINYQGYYKEAAIVDQRLAASISLGFVAVKKPVGAEVSKALIRAHDSCGRVCQAACLDPITGYFKECKGAIAVSAEKPAMYGTTYDEAVMSVFDYEHNSHLPQFKTSNFFITFYCDYQSNFPYTNYRPGEGPQPPVAANLQAAVVPPLKTDYAVYGTG